MTHFGVLMKIFKIVSLSLLAIIVTFAWLKSDNLKRLYHVITLFDEDKIVQNFSNIKDLVPTAEIKPNGPASVFGQDPKALPETFVYKGKEKSVDDFIEESGTTALLVVKGSDITYEHY